MELKIGDLVLDRDGTLGMIEGFDMNLFLIKIDWFGSRPAHTIHVSWRAGQTDRSRYLDFREKLK